MTPDARLRKGHNAIIESWDRGKGVARDLYTGKALKITDAQIIPHDKPHTVVVGQRALLDFTREGDVLSITLLSKKKRTKVTREQTQETDVHFAVSIATSGLATGKVSGVKIQLPDTRPENDSVCAERTGDADDKNPT